MSAARTGDASGASHSLVGLTRAVVSTGMLDMTPDCVKVIALDGRLLHLNAAGRRALGLGGDAELGMPWLTLLPADLAAPVRQRWRRHGEAGQPASRVAASTVRGRCSTGTTC